MKISTKGRYALRLMLDLAEGNSDEYIKIKDISKRQGISDKYLEQIVTVLSRAGYVRSVRGANGGYKLAKDPKDYTVGMILRLTEGSLAPVDCLKYDDNDCSRFDTCATVEVWRKMDEAIANVIDSYTLEDLVSIQKNKEKLKIVK